jgi:DNA polymerase-3 subunit alpha
VDSDQAVARPALALEKALTEYTQREQLLWERELLGLYLSQHPLSMYETFLEEQTMPMSALRPEHEGRGVVLGGAINDIREITTKNGAKMAFVKLEDKTTELELILFPNAYQQTIDLWERDRVILVRGKISAKDREGNLGEEIKILVDDAREITAAQAMAYQPTGKKMRPPGSKRSAAAAVTATKGVDPEELKKKKTVAAATLGPAKPIVERIYIRLQDSQNQDLLRSLKQSLDESTGSTEVVLVLGPSESKQIIKLPGGIQKDQPMLDKLQQLCGTDNVKVQ